MIRKLMVARSQKKAQMAFARKWMVTEPKRKPRPAQWVRRWDDPAPRGLMARMRSSLLLRVAAGGTGAMMATGGMAYAGVLPDPVQRVVSNVAAKAGLDVPSPDDGTELADAGDETTEEDKGSETSKAVREVTRDKKKFETGRDFGKAVSGAAHRANEERKAAKAASKGDGEDETDGTKVPPGQVKKASKVHPVRDEEGKNASKPPAKTDAPGKPEHPVKPEPPAKPEKPEKPPKPEPPAKPEKPAKPEEPTEEVETEEPNEPVDKGKDKSKGKP